MTEGERREDARYWRRLIAGTQPLGYSGTQHYWRWPLMLRWRWGDRAFFSVSMHGVRDGVVRGLGPFHPAHRSFLWIGPVGIEFGWQRQRIENWRWRRSLRDSEGVR
jgi:hypothetical protein